MNTIEQYAYFGRKEKVVWILDRLPYGFPLRSSSGSHYYDILHLCANQRWEDVVYYLQRKYKLKSLQSDHVGRTLLHWALEYSPDLDKIEWSEYGTSGLNAQDRDGLTALHIAVMNRNMDAMDLLMASGADCFIKDNRGMSPAHVAADMGFRKALQLFTRANEREFGRIRSGASLLHLLAMWFEGPLVRNFVLTKRALVNVVDKQRMTPLHYAAISNNTSAAEQLIRLGALVNVRDENGRTALHEAIRGGAVATASLLLDLGADPKATDSVGQNCLHLCIRYDAESLLDRLLLLGVDINAVDSFGMRPIHRACASGDVQRIRRLIEAGADWGAYEPQHPSPLDSAVESRSIDAVGYVLSLMDHPKSHHLPTRMVATRSLKVAGEHDFMAVEGMLLRARAIPPQGGIKIKKWYMTGPTPEKRWPSGS